jgi:hypothetical protein
MGSSVLASIRLAAGSAAIWHPATLDYIHNIDRPVYAGSMSYGGSKATSGAYQAIIAQMPPHDSRALRSGLSGMVEGVQLS